MTKERAEIVAERYKAAHPKHEVRVRYLKELGFFGSWIVEASYFKTLHKGRVCKPRKVKIHVTH